MINLHDLDHFRMVDPQTIAHFGNAGDHKCGRFMMPSPEGGRLLIVASADSRWEHVSVSRRNRCPSWDEMEFVKRRFFKPDEYAYQLHVSVERHINCHPFTLHLWRPVREAIPLPPRWMVGPYQGWEADSEAYFKATQ